jgi:hypothetical protein
MGYTKLFSSIVMSTIWRESNETRLVWITMLAVSDADGIVEGSVPGLADAARVSLGECERALAVLEAPDPYSRTKTAEGRRIEPVPGGWRIINYEHHRDRCTSEERREKERLRKARQRSRKSQASRGQSQSVPPVPEDTPGSLDVPNVPQCPPKSTHAEAEAEEEAELDPSLQTTAEDLSGSAGAETPEPQQPSPTGKVPCPGNLTLTHEQRGTLVAAQIPGWAIDQLTTGFVSSAMADPEDRRPLVAWRKCLSKAITGDWNNSAKRPRQPVESDTAQPTAEDSGSWVTQARRCPESYGYDSREDLEADLAAQGANPMPR